MIKVLTKESEIIIIKHFNYTLFKLLCDSPIRLFELGIGTTDPLIKSAMGESEIPGASLRAWREFFRNGNIFGADIDKTILVNECRIESFYCDQTDEASICRMWKWNPSLAIPFDIIIDDGLHDFQANKVFLENSIQHLKFGSFNVKIGLRGNTVGYGEESEVQFKMKRS